MTKEACSEPSPFRLGVNYWPATSAMAFWKCWDDGIVAEDFRRIRGAGFDSVRLFLTWEDFQTDLGVVNSEALARLVETVDLAKNAELNVMPTLFTGHMSGANFLPVWAVESTKESSRFRNVCDGQVVPGLPKNWFTDAEILRAQVRLAGACAAALNGHPALIAWDLGNENSNCAVPPNKESARAWLSAVTETIRKNDPAASVTIGIHMEDLEEDRHLGPAEAAEFCDFLTMHGYPGYASFADGPTDERLLPFLAQLTRFLGNDKDVFFTEFGVPSRSLLSVPPVRGADSETTQPALVSEIEAAQYIGRGLEALQQCGAIGAMTWCYSDYSPTLFDTPPFDLAPHERSFGMFRANGRDKPAVEAVHEFSLQNPLVSRCPLVAASRFIDVTAQEYLRAPQPHLARLFRRYCAAAG